MAALISPENLAKNAFFITMAGAIAFIGVVALLIL